ncbi:MAG TPA: ABC transporter ATP-binding protein [Gammaproteobacteria bacterium]|nr:ABC transporter ATP-binding protein [Gammaproteobacteria bacterium]
MDISREFISRAIQLGKEVSSPAGLLTILQDITLDIRRGECLAIVGVSGSGKSTMLGLLAGLDTPTHGEVYLNGANLGVLDEDGRARIRNQYVGFVFQSFQLLPSLTALENVMLPLELAGNDNAETEAMSRLDEVGLGQRLQHYPSQLSGGEQQRVAIARAFAGNPEILFADEPTGNLDRETAGKIIRLIFDLNRDRGTTLVLVTHDHAIADQCDRKLTLAGGRIVTASEQA